MRSVVIYLFIELQEGQIVQLFSGLVVVGASLII